MTPPALRLDGRDAVTGDAAPFGNGLPTRREVLVAEGSISGPV